MLLKSALPCPFPPQMELLCEHQQIRVLLDGRQLCDFTHRIQPLNLVKVLRISGDIKLTKVAWKKETTISPEDRGKCIFSCLRNVLSFSPGWFWRVGIISSYFADVFDIHPFFPPMHTHSNCRAMAGLDKSQSLCWDTLLASQTARFMMLCSISHPYGSLPLRHVRWQSSVLCGGWLLLALWLELGIMQVVGQKREAGDFLINE